MRKISHMNESEEENNPFIDPLDRAIFYPVAFVGAIFCMSIFVIIAATFGAADNPVNEWVNKNATQILLWETLLLVTVSIGAMTYDRIRTMRRMQAMSDAAEDETDVD